MSTIKSYRRAVNNERHLVGGWHGKTVPASDEGSIQALLIYYLLKMEIRDIAIIASEETVDIYRKLLEDGSWFGAVLIDESILVY